MSTIFDVAKEAGVSITTVSRALNGYSDVNEATRQRIFDIAQSLEYYPSAAARNLQGRRTDTVAFAPLLRDHIESEQFFKEFLGLLTLSAFRHNLSLLASIADAPSNSGKIYRELAGSGRVDGIILADIKPHDERIDVLGSLDIPFVAFGRTADFEDFRYPFVDVDNEAGIRSIVEYLAGKGHRRIAYLSGPLNTSYSLHRYGGYQEGLKKHHLPVDENLVIAGLQERQDTAKAVARLLTFGRNEIDGGERPTAIITSNDHLALDVIQELQVRDITVGSGPECMAVTGFDDLPFTAYVQPALTTVRQPIAAISDILLDLLVLIIKNVTESKKKVTLPAKAVKLEQYAQASATRRADRAPRGKNSAPLTRWIGPIQALVEPEIVIRNSA